MKDKKNHHFYFWNLYKFILKLLKIEYGKNLRLIGMPIIYKKKNAKMKIGKNVVIKSSFLSNLIGLYQRTIIIARTPESSITIGNNVGMSGVTIYSRKKIKIGDNTLLGGNVKILDNDFHPIEYEDRNLNDESKIRCKEINIGKNCFIGCNSIILKGTVLGDGCVVGAGSVVSGTFEENSVIAGNPAKVIRRINNEK